MKKLKKIIVIFVTFLMLSNIIINNVQAGDGPNLHVWISCKSMGESPSKSYTYIQGESYYLCYDLRDNGNLFNTSDNYVVKITIFNPDGTTNLSHTYSNSNNKSEKFTVNQSGTYKGVVTLSGALIGSSTVTINVPPLILTQSPSSQTVKLGSIVKLSASAKDGNINNYQAQWYCASTANTPYENATPIGDRLYNIKTSTCSFTAQKSDNGKYFFCQFYDGSTVVRSESAKLTVYYPHNVSGPSSQSVKVGNTAKFSVTASGGNPSTYTYQWYYANSSGGSGTKINGATSSSYSFTTQSLQNGRYYYCEVSNGQYTVTSSRAKLTVYYSHNVSSPSSQSVKVGNTAKFSVTASGGNPSTYTYQWYYATSLEGSGTKISGATSSAYSFSTSLSDSGKYFYCIVNNGQYSVTSDRAKLTVSKFDLADCSFSSLESYTYTGNAIKPGLTVKNGSKILISGTDYTLSYSNNINAGTGKITISGKGNYTGSVVKTFTIKKASYNPTIKGYTGKYDGKSHGISITGIKSGSTTKYSIDNKTWTTTNPSQINAGKTTVYYQITNPNYQTISGSQTIVIDKLTQSITTKVNSYKKIYGSKSFSLNAKAKSSMTYTSSNKKIATVSKTGIVSIKGCGKATITIKAGETSDYKTATKKITVTVVPRSVKKSSIRIKVNPKKKRALMTWTRDKSVTGYQIETAIYKSFKGKKAVKVSSNKKSATIKGIKLGKVNYIGIRTYKTVSGKRYYSSWCTVSFKAPKR